MLSRSAVGWASTISALIEKGKRRVLATEIKQLAVGYRLDPCTVLFLY